MLSDQIGWMNCARNSKEPQKGKSKANNSFCKQTKIGSRKKTPSDRSTLTDRRTKSQSKYFNLQIGGTQGFIHAVHARYQKQCKIVTRIIHAHADTNGHSHTQTHTHKHAHEQSHALQIREHARTNACTLAHKQPRTHTHSLKCCTWWCSTDSLKGMSRKWRIFLT